MIQKTIRFSAENRLLVILLTLALLGFSYFAMKNIPIDAIPDLSDTQVIIFSRWDRSPDILEDQVTYPIITSLLGAPKVKSIRGFSDFGYSYVYVIFQDGTDIYWARSRVAEYLSKIQSSLPQGVKTEIGPDASAVGWVFQYILLDKTGKLTPAEIRSFQDFRLKYLLSSVPGVAEVASLGGFRKQYQIQLDPSRLFSYNIPMTSIIQKVKEGNREAGARLTEIGGAEYMIRGRGYVQSIQDLERISIGTDGGGTPIFLKNVARIVEGPDIRRGIQDYNGKGDTVGGIIVMRHGENALNVIARVKARISEISPSFPSGVELKAVYDRSELIEKTAKNLKVKLIEEILIVSFVILVFLWHFPSAIVPILTIPVSIAVSFIPMYIYNVQSNLMSLSGIAISIGVLVDGAIVEVENAYKKLEHWESTGRQGDYHAVRLEALLEVGPSVFYSLLIVAASFLPVFTLVDMEGRLFKPLAITKTLTMVSAAILALTLDPALRMAFTRMDPFYFKSKIVSGIANSILIGKYYPEEKHPISKAINRYYEPIVHFVLKHPKKIILGATASVLLTIPLYFSLGSEFMPPLDEETILYMPTTMPGISVSEAQKLLLLMDKKLMKIPEIQSVAGKSGRAETSTDPAPFSMMETVIQLKPKSEWRILTIQRFYSNFPNFLQIPFRFLFPDKQRVNKEQLIAILDNELKIPGTSNAWTMPIKARIDMLSTGVRTPIGIKIMGGSLEEIEKTGKEIETSLKSFPGTRSVFAERATGGYFLDIDLRREKLARYGISVSEAQDVIMSAIGGEQVTETIEGRERYSVNIRYPRELRDTKSAMKNILLPIPAGGHIPIGEVADLNVRTGPAMIRDENGLLTGYVYVDTANPDIGSYVEQAKKKIASEVQIPTGLVVAWSGQYENMQRVRERLKIILPLTIFLVLLLIYMNTKSWIKTLIIFTAVPFSLIGSVLLISFLDYQISVAIWVGMIALMGLDAETGSFMLLYLDLNYEKLKKEGNLNSIHNLQECIVQGAAGRLRPKLMTVLAAFLGLLPILWSDGTGSDLMKRIAAPMVGGLFTSFLLELLVYPAIYLLWKKRELKLLT